MQPTTLKEPHLTMKATLANPLLVWIYSTALLLIGCGVGRHWLHTPAFWLCSIGGVLMAVHDLVTGFLWFFVTARWVRAVTLNAHNRG